MPSQAEPYLCDPVVLCGHLQVSTLLGVQRCKLVLPLPAPQQCLSTGMVRAWESREESSVASFPISSRVQPSLEQKNKPNLHLGGKTAREELVSPLES